MPLVKTTLESGIKTALETEFKSSNTKKSLRKLLDGNSSAGKLSSAKNIADALDNIEKGTEAVSSLPADQLNSSYVQDLIKQFMCNEWANAISECVSEWMSDEIAPIIAKTIADQVDIYIKSATIITPPGQAVVTSTGPGSTTTPSQPALIS